MYSDNKTHSMRTAMKSFTSLSLITTTALTLLSSHPVMAQSIDYTAMKELFGEPVTTSATGKPQRMSDAPITMEILTQDDIRRSGAVDLPEVLRMVNGVNIMQNSTQSYDVSIRGYNQGFSQRLLVLINGRQVYDENYGTTHWSSLPVQLEEIQQIEIVKGPNTALFGFNAVSGVVNIVTYNPLYDDVSSAGIRLGNHEYRQGHYVQSLKLTDKLGFRVSAGKRESNKFTGSPNGFNSLRTTNGSDISLVYDPEQTAINLDGMWQVSDRSQLRLELSKSNTKQANNFSSGPLRSEYDTKSGKLTYEVDSDYGLIKINAYKNILDFELLSEVSSQPITGTNKISIIQLEDTFEINPDHTMRINLEYRNNSIESDVTGFLSPGARVTYDVYAASGMWNWTINDQWSWTNAIRLDHLNLDHNGVLAANNPWTVNDFDMKLEEFSYNSGLVWKATHADTIRLMTARGLEIPSLSEFTLEAASGFLTLIGNPYLDIAVVTNYELAWDHKIESIENGLFRAAAFHQKTQDIKSLQALLDFPYYRTDNIGTSTSDGLEMELSGTVNSNIDWSLGYIFQHINDDLNNKNAAGILNVPKGYENSNPRNQVKLKLGYAEGPWEADALAYYVSDYSPITFGTTPPQDHVDAYIGVNARPGYTFDNDLTLAVQGTNLQSTTTHTAPLMDIERRFYVSLTKKF